MTMFWVGDRLAAHALLYAPAPMQQLGSRYGMMSHGVACGGGTDALLAHCHGPHMYIERMLGPVSGDPTDMAQWRRPFRRDRVAPRDSMLAVGPVVLNGHLVWPVNTQYNTAFLFQDGAKIRFEMCFAIDPSTYRCSGQNTSESRMKEFKPHFYL